MGALPGSVLGAIFRPPKQCRFLHRPDAASASNSESFFDPCSDQNLTHIGPHVGPTSEPFPNTRTVPFVAVMVGRLMVEGHVVSILLLTTLYVRHPQFGSGGIMCARKFLVTRACFA